MLNNLAWNGLNRYVDSYRNSAIGTKRNKEVAALNSDQYRQVSLARGLHETGVGKHAQCSVETERTEVYKFPKSPNRTCTLYAWYHG